jgi:NAD(P)-dependent dehydrogenase (short-subunit alcohol dehydrogenase family)
MTRWTTADMPDLSGTTALVTGANSGLGFHTALELARAGAHTILAGRDDARGTEAIARIRAEAPVASVEWQPLDLASLASVRQAAKAVTGELDLLVNNAGVMMPPYGRTDDGFEQQFGVNHLGHFALTGLLLPALLARPAARVVTLSSMVHRGGAIDFGDLQSERGYSRTGAYAQSKLANLTFALELARRAAHTSLLSVAAHPGFAATSIGSRGGLFNTVILRVGMRLGQPPAIGALATLRAATGPDVASGEFYGPGGPAGMYGYPARTRPAPHACDGETARRLWEVSEELTGVRFDALAGA